MPSRYLSVAAIFLEVKILGFGSSIEDFFQELLSGCLQKSLSGAYDVITDSVGLLEGKVAETPQQFGGGAVYTALKAISDAAILPVGVGIMAIIICYDLISACIDNNNMKEFDTSVFFKFIIKAFVAIYLLNNVFTLCSDVFKLGSSIAGIAFNALFKNANGNSFIGTATGGSLINSSTGDLLKSEEFKNILSELDISDLFLSCFLSLIVYIVSLAVMIIVLVVVSGRMIEILIYFCAAPIPFGTLTNKEWSNVGFSYIKNIFALALQGFFIVITLAIYVVLFNANVTNISTNYSSMTSALFNWICYSVVCCFMLLKTGSISKSILGAH